MLFCVERYGIGEGVRIPALLMRTSRWPGLALTCSKAFSIDSSLVRSTWTTSTVLVDSGHSLWRVSIASFPFSRERLPRKMR